MREKRTENHLVLLSSHQHIDKRSKEKWTSKKKSKSKSERREWMIMILGTKKFHKKCQLWPTRLAATSNRESKRVERTFYCAKLKAKSSRKVTQH